MLIQGREFVGWATLILIDHMTVAASLEPQLAFLFI